MSGEKPNNVKKALRRLTVFDVWSLAPFASQDVPGKDGVYLSPFKESKNKTGSLSISGAGRFWNDFSGDGGRRNVYAFVEECRPDWSKDELHRYLVKKAGLNWDEPNSRKRTWTAEEKRAWKKEKQAREAEAYEAAWSRHESEYAFPEPLPRVPEMPVFVAERWDDGQAFLNARQQVRLAKSRGWPSEWAAELVNMDLVSCPRMPGCWDAQDHRSLAFLVQQPNEDFTRLDPVGYHQTFKFPASGKRGFFYVPNSKAKQKGSPSPFQKQMQAFAKETCRAVGDSLVPALPVVLGFPCKPRAIVVFEGQWDAFTFWGALGGFERSFNDPLVVFGLRGASGINAFLGAWGPWLLEHRPNVFLMPDNDTPGSKWVAPSYGAGFPNVTFRQRLERAGLSVQFSQVAPEFGKDFNDYYKAKQPRKENLRRWLKTLELL